MQLPINHGTRRVDKSSFYSYKRAHSNDGEEPVAARPMLTHADIWNAVDCLAARSKLSASGLAKAAGLDPTTFNKSKRITPKGRPRWPSTESISKSLQATGVSVDAFVSLITDRAGTSTRAIPLIGLAEAAAGSSFTDTGFPSKGWHEIAFPAINDEHVYAIEVSGNAMEPAYRDGTVVVVSPNAAIRRGDRVVLKMRSGEVLLQELKRRSARSVDLRALDPGHEERSLSIDEVLWIARIMWASQ
jgi:phage repressor protein C with HTH and peptisase S24 domain